MTPSGLAGNEAEFLAGWPEYASTRSLDQLRAREYGRLDRLGHVYLDYTGGGLYSDRQVKDHIEMLESHVFGNPHSRNPASVQMTELVEGCRRKVLDYFHASPDEYVVVFTANASSALKLVGEAYPFSPEGRYLLTFDNHNSVNGIREFARRSGTPVSYVPLWLPDLTVDEENLRRQLREPGGNGAKLFAYPAQSNFSGTQHPLEWIAEAQERGWDVLLDAAAYVPTNQLDLSKVRPDFVVMSFYKMFGYPTGVGCLLARHEALRKLHRPWFSGGTITVASVQGDQHFMAEGSAAFEDGTVDYLNIPAVEIGLRHLERTGIETIHTRVRCLAGWLIDEMVALRYRNGNPVVGLYGPGARGRRGGTVTFNFYDARGNVVDHRRVEEAAAAHGISLRTGCFCNPGGGEVALSLSKNELIGCFSQPRVLETHHFTVDDFQLCVDGKSTGAVRVSFGIVSNFDDAARFAEFARSFAA